MRRITVRQKGNNETINDEFGLTTLTVDELKEELRGRGLQVSGLKHVLVARLEAHLRQEYANDDDGDGENDYDDNGEAGGIGAGGVGAGASVEYDGDLYINDNDAEL